MRYVTLALALVGLVALLSADEILTPSLPSKPQDAQSEVDMQAKAIGIDYGHLERMALGGDHDALAVIVALTFDGGAGEDMASRKITILTRSPADEVARVLEIYSPDFRASLLAQMKKEFLWLNGDKKSVSEEFDRRFGRLTKKQKAEQDGAGQPATRPESESKGGNKPQPKAEGRSR